MQQIRASEYVHMYKYETKEKNKIKKKVTTNKKNKRGILLIGAKAIRIMIEVRR